MQISAFLYFNGNCREAFSTYQHILGGELGPVTTFGDLPELSEMPGLDRDSIAHATLTWGNVLLRGADRMGDAVVPQGFQVSADLASEEEAQRVFAALAKGGEVDMPLSKPSWGTLFGTLVDRFGTPWVITC